MNSEIRTAWSLSFYHANYCYSAVIAPGKSNEYCTEIMTDFPSAAIEHNTFLPHGSALSHVLVM